MIIALLSDIHANLPALTAVIADLPAVDTVFCTGDLVGYYPYPNEVCNAIKDLGGHTIRGNHDAYVTGELTPDCAKMNAYRTLWTRRRVTPENRRWLASLPVETVFAFGDARITLRHASPWDEETYLYRNTETIREISLRSHEWVVLGHTHHPMKIRCGKGWLVNPGSVGQPRDYNPMASYAVLDTDSGQVRFHRVPYDVEAFQSDLAQRAWEQGSIAILSRRPPR